MLTMTIRERTDHHFYKLRSCSASILRAHCRRYNTRWVLLEPILLALGFPSRYDDEHTHRIRGGEGAPMIEDAMP